ncbi:MAG: retropepsin-like aspartic protease family protein [Pirellulaceae bacterium]
MNKPIPFQLAKPEKPLMLLAVLVNGEGPFHFVLDTGASLTIISPELADRLAIRRNESETAIGAGGSIQAHFGTVQSLSVGDTRLEALQVGIIDLQGISQACETNLDGIIGYNFLNKFRVLIDYPNQTVTFE